MPRFLSCFIVLSTLSTCFALSTAQADDKKRKSYYYYCEQDANDAKGFRAAIVLSNVFEGPNRVSGHDAGVQFNALVQRRLGDKYQIPLIGVICHDYERRKDAVDARDTKITDSKFDKLKREYIDDFSYESE